MIKILVGSKNPVKIEAVRSAFLKYYDEVDVYGYAADSGVADQPVNEETFQGAKNRAEALRELNENDKLNADFFVGIEGGIAKFFNQWFAFGLMCIIDKEDNIGFGSSPMFELPAPVTEELLQGIELGTVMDRITNEHNTKQKGGAIGFFTNGVMNRKELYVSGLITALIPFQHKQLFFGRNGQDVS